MNGSLWRLLISHDLGAAMKLIQTAATPALCRGGCGPREASGHRTVVIVAPHFPPSNLAGVHRARLLCQHLHEFGWRPIVVTTHWRHYEEVLDWDLASLVAPDLEVIQTSAAPTRPIRLIGDIGIRALPWHLAALRRLRQTHRVDFVLITVPSFFSAVLGQMLWRDCPLPFGVDYIDPWVTQLAGRGGEILQAMGVVRALEAA